MKLKRFFEHNSTSYEIVSNNYFYNKLLGQDHQFQDDSGDEIDQYVRSRILPYTYKEIEEIKKVFINIKFWNALAGPFTCALNPREKIVMESGGGSIEATKYSDEWYYVHYYNHEEIIENGHSLYFECDQFNGLINCLNYIKSLINETYIKKFETNSWLSRKEEFLNKCWKSSKIGDIKPESDIYQYVQQLHHDYNDFVDGDLGNRIEEYSYYKLKEIDINKIDLEEFDTNDDMLNQYIEKTQSEKYPPIILSNDYQIIDGNHRANALSKLGYKKIIAWVGIN